MKNGPKTAPIIDYDIELLIEARAGAYQSKQLAENMAELAKQLEANMRARLEAGAKVKSDRYRVALAELIGRRSVSWKEIARALWERLKLDPDREEQKVLDSTEPTVKVQVIVEEVED